MRIKICIAMMISFASEFASAQQQIPKPAIDALAAARKPIESIDDGSYKCDSTMKRTCLEQGKSVTSTSRSLAKVSGQNSTYGSCLTSPNVKEAKSQSYDGLISLNSRYLFKADRSKLSDSWVLVKVARNDSDLESSEPELVRLLNFSSTLAFEGLFTIPLKVGDTKADGLTGVPNFSLESFVESADKRRFTIVFRCAGATKGVADSTISMCRVV